MLRACHCQIPRVNQTNCRPHTHVGRRESWCRGCRESVSLTVRMRGEGGCEASQSSLCKLDLGRKIVGFRDDGNACSTESLWLRVQNARHVCHTSAMRVCERNQNTHPLNLNPQIMYPSRTGIHETTICQTELDPYQPAKALVQTFDLRICVAFVRHRSLTHVAAGLSRGESVNKTACIKRHVEVEHRNLKFS